MPEPTLNDVMAAYAQDAVDFARNNFNVELDYTNQSIERVEGGGHGVRLGFLFHAIPPILLCNTKMP